MIGMEGVVRRWMLKTEKNYLAVLQQPALF